MLRALTGSNARAALRLWKWAPGTQMAAAGCQGTPNVLGELLCPDPTSQIHGLLTAMYQSLSANYITRQNRTENRARVRLWKGHCWEELALPYKWNDDFVKKIGRVFGKNPALAALIFLNAFICFILFTASSFQECPIMFHLGASQPANSGVRRWLPPSWPLP